MAVRPGRVCAFAPATAIALRATGSAIGKPRALWCRHAPSNRSRRRLPSLQAGSRRSQRPIPREFTDRHPGIILAGEQLEGGTSDGESCRRGRRTGLAARMKKSLRVVLLFLLSLAVIGALLWFGDIKKVGTLIEHFQRIYFLWFLLLMLAHEALRTALWVYLLRALAIS